MNKITINDLDLEEFLNKPKKLDFNYDLIEVEFNNSNNDYMCESYNSWLELVCDLNVNCSIYMNKKHFEYIMINTKKEKINFETLYLMVNSKCLDINSKDFEYILNICLDTVNLGNNIYNISYFSLIVDKFKYDYTLDQLYTIKEYFIEFNKTFCSMFFEFKLKDSKFIDDLIQYTIFKNKQNLNNNILSKVIDKQIKKGNKI